MESFPFGIDLMERMLFFIQDYDFEMHYETSLKMFPRNIATLIGGPPGGWPNTKFRIKYNGNTNITNP